MFKTYLALLFFAAFFHAANALSINATTYVYKTIGDVQIELDVYVPPVSPPQTGYPVFFAIHGGAWIFGKKEAAFTEQEFNETMRRGWVVVSINYRLIPCVVLKDMIEDIQDAYDWVRSKLITIVPINPDLITLFGQSAGGGLVLTSAYKLTPRPTAVISFYPAYTNWTFLKTKSPANKLIVADAKRLRLPVLTYYDEPKHPLKDARVDLLIAAVDTGELAWLATTEDASLPADQIMALLKEFSPTENVDDKFPAIYLAHGLKDQAVTYKQSVQLRDQLNLHNVPVVLDLIPGANHIFDYNSSYWQDHVLPAFEWAGQYMGGSTKLAYE